jgi:DNA invertase Pin-like site-specific DNA recombinase
MQLQALREYCKARAFEIEEYIDNGVSGTKSSRPALDRLMDDARKRKIDCVLVYRFDRFARSSRHLILALEEFASLGIDFISFQENIDTSSPLGKAIFTIVSAMSELERNIIAERVISGLKAARSKGKQLGRPQVSFDLEQARRLKSTGMSLRDIAKELGVSKTTIGRALSQKPLSKAA